MDMRKLLGMGCLMMMLGCGQGISDEEADERAVLGLQTAIERVISLGFTAFNLSNSANIDETTGAGDESGTLTLNGQIDQGNSDNKGMRLDVVLADYSDGDVEETVIVYDSPEGEPADVDLDLRDVPEGTLAGTWIGRFDMSGDLTGAVNLELALSGGLVAGDDGTVLLEQDSTMVTGTAISDFGAFDVDFSF